MKKEPYSTVYKESTSAYVTMMAYYTQYWRAELKKREEEDARGNR